MVEEAPEVKPTAALRIRLTSVPDGPSYFVLKVPEVKSGGYNISIQEGDKILILPVRFTVQS